MQRPRPPPRHARPATQPGERAASDDGRAPRKHQPTPAEPRGPAPHHPATEPAASTSTRDPPGQRHHRYRSSQVATVKILPPHPRYEQRHQRSPETSAGGPMIGAQRPAGAIRHRNRTPWRTPSGQRPAKQAQGSPECPGAVSKHARAPATLRYPRPRRRNWRVRVESPPGSGGAFRAERLGTHR